MNDYGFLIGISHPAGLEKHSQPVCCPTKTAEDILGSLNATEMCRRQFREIARIAGLSFKAIQSTKAQPPSASLKQPVL